MLRNLKFFIIITNLLILFALPGFAEAKQVKIDVNSINVRTGPGTEYSTIHTLTKDSTYQVLEEKDRWYKINFDANRNGWIASWLVTEIDGQTVTTSAVKPATMTQVVESTIPSLNVRTGPSTAFTIVRSIKPQEFYPVVSTNGDWIEIRLDNQNTGWVTKELVTISNREMSTPSQDQSVIVTATILNIRSEPNTSSTILNKLTQGQSVKLLEIKDGWYKIQSENVTGWIAAEYAKQNENQAAGGNSNNPSSLAPEANPSEKPEGSEAGTESGSVEVQTAVVNVTTLNIRSGPGTDYPTTGSLKQNDIVTVLKQQDDWLNISFNGAEGWIANWLVTLQTKEQPISQIPKVVIPTTGINIRSGPDTTYSIVASANEGDTFPIVNTHGQWYEITLPDGKNAYVASWVVQTTGIENVPTDRSIEGLLKGKTIVVDPGHGGIDSGGIGSHFKTLEKDLTLPTATFLANKLKAAGANVVMTRTTDIYLNLGQRVAVSVNSKADAFISIHYNKNHNPAINGTIVYHYTANGEDAKFAKIMQEEIIKQNNLKNMGARQENFYVLRENPQLAVLVEAAFLSNYNDEMLSRTSSFQEKVAEGIFQGVLKYFNK